MVDSSTGSEVGVGTRVRLRRNRQDTVIEHPSSGIGSAKYSLRERLCLVPSVQIPAKFKVPDFEKYKGSSCPQSHLVMYARKMSTYADNHQLLIHYFQDSLTGAALKWYTGLDSTNIRTFNDLGEAFVRQYKYNWDMAPDRDQLRSMAQKDHEAFKEYAQRWRETAAQINPPLKEKEMTKIFLNTLSPFYYERMIASAPSDFTEMVNMGMRLEEGVRTGRLTKEGGSSSGTKKFGSSFPKKKEQSVDMIICLPVPVPYDSDKALPYNYNATMIKNGQEVPLPTLSSVVNIADVSRVIRSGRVYTPLPSKQPVAPATGQNPVNVPVGNPVETPVSNTSTDVGQSSGTNVNPDFDEILKFIKRSEYKIVDQLMQTPSKISILSLLLNSEAHREALMRVLDQAFVDHDVTVDHFDGIIANITACNNLSFCDEELPEEGRNHNLALHISMNCQSDSLSNVLVDTGSSLNVMPKTTLARLSYQGMPMKFSGVVVKAFDGSRKSVIGEVNLPMTIGPHTFQITFQVMDIQAAYSCLLGRPWIHEAGAVTSTLHQKLKFVTNRKLVTISGEQALMVSHLSNFSFISADNEEGTPFQGLSLEDESSKKKASISSYKEAVKVVKDGTTTGWGQVVIPTKNETRAGLGCVVVETGRVKGWGQVIDVRPKFDKNGLGFNPGKQNASPKPDILSPIKFVSGGVIQDGQVNAIVNGEEVDSDCDFDS
ncbi:uncharacterized protein LOC131597183 [Vicia villosa]|uniref:uncharacterized protein LOC131597183 n=1 Tax=Vicia villosa TaxID=3911 RepID=UPI00273CC082|nr:uncharacterized protein LOC131597183 [Vicia villosa]